MTRGALCFANIVLLTSHEIDSAFWREWEMFGLPGGVQAFVLVNSGLLALVLFGYTQVILDRSSATRWALVLAAMGGAAVVAHGLFLLLGRPQFRTPVSLAVLGLIGIVSALQVAQESRTAVRSRITDA